MYKLHVNVFKMLVIIEHILSLLKVPYTRTYLKSLVESYPEQENLLGFSKVLALYGVDSLAVKLKSTASIQSEMLPCISLWGDQFVLIKEIRDSILTIQTDKSTLKIEVDKFSTRWIGSILMVEASDFSKEPFYEANRQEEISRIILRSFLFFGIAISAFFVNLHNSEHRCISLFVNIAVMLIALSLSLSLLKQSILHKYTSRLCAFLGKDNCRHTHNDIDFSDMGIAYWGTALILLLIHGGTQFELTLYILTAFPFSLWFMWYQKFILKKICILCSFVHLCVFILLLYNASRVESFELTSIRWTLLLIIGVSFLTIYSLSRLIVRNYYKTVNKSVDYRFNERSIKGELIRSLASNRNKDFAKRPPEDFVMGKIDAPIQLIVVTNPFCYQCKQDFLSAYNAMRLTSNMRISIVLVCGSKEQEKWLNFLLSFRGDQAPICKILYDWFSLGKSSFFNHYTKRPKQLSQDVCFDTIRIHKEWVVDSHISATPTLFMNGYRLHDSIHLADIFDVI